MSVRAEVCECASSYPCFSVFLFRLISLCRNAVDWARMQSMGELRKGDVGLGSPPDLLASRSGHGSLAHANAKSRLVAT